MLRYTEVNDTEVNDTEVNDTKVNCLMVCKTFEPYLLVHINTIMNLREIVSSFHIFPENSFKEHIQIVYEIVKERLYFFQNATMDDFIHTLIYFSESQRTEIYKKNKDRLPMLINNNHDLSMLLIIFNAEQCKEICKTIDDKQPNFFKNEKNIAVILSSTSTEEIPNIYQAIKHRIVGFLKNEPHKLDFLLRCISNKTNRIDLLVSIGRTTLRQGISSCERKKGQDFYTYKDDILAAYKEIRSENPSNYFICRLFGYSKQEKLRAVYSEESQKAASTGLLGLINKL